LREAVTGYARACGLSEFATADLVLVAHELATNVVRHGGGEGQMRLWAAGSTACCQVSDNGPGLPDPTEAGRTAVPATAPTGRGLWLIRQLTDEMSIDSGPDGTTITVCVTAKADD
jgi:anti-sigma regulatory factor (Ser/Thr protein kinase)